MDLWSINKGSKRIEKTVVHDDSIKSIKPLPGGQVYIDLKVQGKGYYHIGFTTPEEAHKDLVIHIKIERDYLDKWLTENSEYKIKE